jgi:DNA polymerase-3 subunit gamma/tau
MAYQSLYRRYRPQRFGQIVGQEHVVKALRNAVRDDRVGHAYLFSGPRGTGKTSTARILAKALNCENLTGGEPCCVCDPCMAIEAGISYDLQELDAASNNKVDDVRDLISRVALGSPGRTKVYILDEVHMLTTGASNALLKTLEEPPNHVKFVLATTDPHKVLDTIRSRTQHFEFTLLGAEALAEHVRWVVQDAGLSVDETGIAHVMRIGGGSARDTLSALEQVAAAGGVDDRGDSVDALLDALADVDTGAALAAVSSAVAAGRDPRVLAEALLGRLRDVFLTRMGAPVEHIPAQDRPRVADWAQRLGDRPTTRALEALGEALLEMRQAPDPRIPLEVALVRLTRAGSEQSLDALALRIEQLEKILGGAAAASPRPAGEAAPSEPAAVSQESSPGPAAGGLRSRPADAARATLAERRRPENRPPAATPRPPPPQAGPASSASPPAAPSTRASPPSPGIDAAAAPVAAAPNAGSEGPVANVATVPDAEVAGAATDLSREGLTLVWADKVMPTLGGLAKAMYGVGRFLEVEGSTAVFALPNEAHRRKCEQKRAEVEAALSSHLGMPAVLRLVVDDGRPGERPTGMADPSSSTGARSGPPDVDEDFAAIDVRDLEDAPDDRQDGVARLTAAFPGAELVQLEDPG